MCAIYWSCPQVIFVQDVPRIPGKTNGRQARFASDLDTFLAALGVPPDVRSWLDTADWSGVKAQLVMSVPGPAGQADMRLQGMRSLARALQSLPAAPPVSAKPRFLYLVRPPKLACAHNVLC